MWNLIPKDVQFFDLFEKQAECSRKAAELLREMVNHFADARAKAFAIKELEHQGDQVTHQLVRRLNTTFVTPIDREDIYALAGRLDDVLDFIDAVAERLVIYRIKEPTSACRAMADVIVEIVAGMNRAVGALRKPGQAFHEHAVEVNRLENRADNLLRESLAELFDQEPDPITVIKWKEIYETMEVVTDRCEDVVNVIEGIVLKSG
jgi:predicted phosphate transport protein (TIGR00153 family)